MNDEDLFRKAAATLSEKLGQQGYLVAGNIYDACRRVGMSNVDVVREANRILSEKAKKGYLTEKDVYEALGIEFVGPDDFGYVMKE